MLAALPWPTGWPPHRLHSLVFRRPSGDEIVAAKPSSRLDCLNRISLSGLSLVHLDTPKYQLRAGDDSVVSVDCPSALEGLQSLNQHVQFSVKNLLALPQVETEPCTPCPPCQRGGRVGGHVPSGVRCEPRQESMGILPSDSRCPRLLFSRDPLV